MANKKLLIHILLALFLINLIANAQKQANNWYFGKKAGITFNDGVPSALLDGMLDTEEGCAVISDENGKLLFYTDGITVWNALHKAMPDGKELKGHPSSTQSGVAIPKPKSKHEYYLFTLAAEAKENGLTYSLIDMKLDSGRGNIVIAEKNVNIALSVTEKLTAVKHRNGEDIWVIAHKWESDEFLAYLVSANGVKKEPVSSKVGAVHKGNLLNTQGYMKANPDGTNLALALENDHIFEIFDFDNNTGIVSQPLTFKLPAGSYTYGIEFSPDGSVLYGSAAGTGIIYQWNLQAGSDEAIQKSIVNLGQSPNKKWVGALQIANNGKIYFPIYQSSSLGVINNPNKLGAEAGYSNEGVSLGDRTNTLGLPTFTQSFFLQNQSKKDIEYFKEGKIETNKKFILNNILFDFAKYDLQSSSFAELKKVAAILSKNPSYKIKIIGHTDNIGNKSANITLSKNRAEAVKNYLVSQKINANRISSEGLGSSEPIENNDSELGRSKNQRVEFILSN